MTIPFEGATPLAIRSHYFEFLEEHGRTCLAHELEPGGVYSVVVTTGGGLYRYRLEDRVACTGFIRATPTLRFFGKESHVSDLVGEKLREDGVAGTLAAVMNEASVTPAFALLAPDVAFSRPCYTLHVEGDVPPTLAGALDVALGAHGDYRYARALGQLGPARVFRVAGEGLAVYLRRCLERGQRLGDIKPLALSPVSGWSGAFDGAYQALDAGEPAAAASGR